MKKLWIFLFGSRYPIFNKDGLIEHNRQEHFEQWKLAYKHNSSKNWRNHKGMHFFKSQK